MRYLGKMAELASRHSQLDYVQHIAVTEMVLRATKRIFRQHLQTGAAEPVTRGCCTVLSLMVLLIWVLSSILPSSLSSPSLLSFLPQLYSEDSTPPQLFPGWSRHTQSFRSSVCCDCLLSLSLQGKVELVTREGQVSECMCMCAVHEAAGTTWRDCLTRVSVANRS